MVNCYTEWGELKEVIVGDCLNFNINILDPTFQYVYYDNLVTQKVKKSKQYKIDKTRFKQRVEDLNNLHDTLEKLNIKVRRPIPLSDPILIKTPWWNAICTAPDSPRDTVACIGNNIIESPPSIRGRYFENTHFRDIFQEYFRKGANWISAPKPSLEEHTVELEKHWYEVNKFHDIIEIPNEYEIVFDAANILKFGKDIIFNVGTKNHELGAIWLQRILGNEFRVNKVRLCDSHIDAVIAPLCPGKMLYNPKANEKRNIKENLPKWLQKWDMIPMQDENLDFCMDKEELYLASEEGMFINCLSINEKQLIIQDNAYKTIKILEKNGFEPIPIPFRQGRLFSGGIHCCTVDVDRNENMEDYR